MVLIKSLLLLLVGVTVYCRDPCQICDSEACDDVCFTVQRERRFNGHPIEHLYNTDFSTCREKCKADVNCKSFSYLCPYDLCHLFKNVVADNPDGMVYDESYSYFEATDCTYDGTTPGPDPIADPDYDCFTTESASAGLNGFSDTFVDSGEACVHSCLAADRLCRGATFYAATNRCILHENVGTTADTDAAFYRKRDECKPDCYFKVYENRYLAGYNDQTVSANTFEECLLTCALENLAGECNSFEFQSSLSNCYLSDDTKSVNHLKFRTSSQYTYAEYECQNTGPTDCFETYQSTYMAGNTKEYFSSSSESACKEACSSRSYCQSALYSKFRSTCYINEDGKDGNTLSSNAYYTLFVKIC